LFTFLGIPTMSVALRHGVGEVRHALLASPAVFKRVNAQYDQPRHTATAWRAAESQGAEQLQSPYWRGLPPAGITHPRPSGDKLTEQMKTGMLQQEPAGFSAFDREVVDLAAVVAANMLLELPALVHRVDGKGFAGVITTADVRGAVPVSLAKDKVHAYLDPLKETDMKDLMGREGKSPVLQETAALYQQYVKESKDQWKAIGL